MSYVRTPEHKALRAELIRRWKPWEKSTGPKTSKGKSVVAQNSWRGAPRATIRKARVIAALIEADALALAQAIRETP